jgi:hypothetical protein
MSFGQPPSKWFIPWLMYSALRVFTLKKKREE